MFTNTRVLHIIGRSQAAVTAMMELWEACFFVVTLNLAFGKGIANATYEIRQIDSCPVEGYFFKRDQSPNQVNTGLCWLCFCQDNGTATCWERERRRCDVEKYHHHRVGRRTGRYRRSFTDIFFRDATRDFFNKNLPEQCKPHESSFSEGCPPADWCMGCTVCDCDSNGRWDCHILSFCDGKESKRKLKRNKPNHRDVDYDTSKEYRPIKKPTRKSTTPITTKPSTKTPTKNFKKVVKAKSGQKTNILRNKPNKFIKPTQNKFQTKQAKTPTRKPKNSSVIQQKALQITSKRRPQQRSQVKKMSQNKKNINNGSKVIKIIKRVVATRKPVHKLHNAIKGLKLNPNNNETVKMGEKIVKQVLTAFQKMIRQEMKKLESNHVQRLQDGLDCVKHASSRDKRTYDEISKASERKNNEYIRPTLVKENYTKTRSKRDITKDLTDVKTVSVITLSTERSAVIPLNAVSETNVNLTYLSHEVTLASKITSEEMDYYKYVFKNNSTWPTTNKQEKAIVLEKINKPETIINVEEPTKPKEDIVKNVDDSENNIFDNLVIPVDTLNYTSRVNVSGETIKNKFMKTINPDLNGLKFDNLHVIKLKKDERHIPVNRVLQPKYSATQSHTHLNNAERTHYKSVTPMINILSNHDVNKKYSFKTRFTKTHSSHYNSKLKTTNRADVTGFTNILENLFTKMNKIYLNKTHTKQRKLKSKVSVLRYIRKFLHKIFSKKQSKSHKVYGLGTKEDHTLQILCENIGPCKIKRNNRMILKYKLNQLNKETHIVLKSIRTVKGLLHLMELPNDEKIRCLAKNHTFNNDIQKLGAVLRYYKENDINRSLTFTQQQQINYIKQNTQTFIDSVKTFANILTDILAMVTPDVSNALEVSSNLHNITSDKTDLNKTKQSLKKIKIILHKYSIMQNTFMEKMYKLINGAEKNAGTTTQKTQILASYNSSNETGNVIEKYSKNIIERLRRLKTISQVFNFNRKKREVIMKDDALDYLLTLMEFMIQKNQPLDRVPASDGIDLLIDAIKHAPEIKPIVFKYYAPIIPLSEISNDLQNLTETGEGYASDNTYDSKRISNEDHDEHINSQDNYIKRLKKPVPIIADDVTQKVYYRIFNENTSQSNEFEITTKKSMATRTRLNASSVKVGFDKFENYFSDSNKSEVFMSYFEDDTTGETTTAANIPLTENTTNQRIKDDIIIPTTNPEELFPLIKYNNGSSSESQDSSDKKIKLDWIEETFDREIREFSKINKSKPAVTRTSIHPDVTTSSVKYVDSNSGVSKEAERLEGKTRKITKNITNNDDVFYEKQTQFLNSLDYGVNNSTDFDDSDSKDDIRTDDAEPAYFV